MGFCLFGNVAIAAAACVRRPRDEPGHGRRLRRPPRQRDAGHLLRRPPRRLPLDPPVSRSTPAPARPTRRGPGPRLGTKLNIPLPYGIPRSEYHAAFERGLTKLADAMRPELVLISAGFDAHAEDPVGDLGLEVEDFVTLTKLVAQVAETHAGGRLVSVLEGGYNVSDPGRLRRRPSRGPRRRADLATDRLVTGPFAMAKPTRDRPRRRLPLAGRIVVAMVLGMVAGLILGERAEPLAKLGSLIIDMIKGLAGPLLLFAVIDAFLRTEVRARSARSMVAIALINAVIALAIGLVLSNTLQPGLTLQHRRRADRRDRRGRPRPRREERRPVPQDPVRRRARRDGPHVARQADRRQRRDLDRRSSPSCSARRLRRAKAEQIARGRDLVSGRRARRRDDLPGDRDHPRRG